LVGKRTPGGKARTSKDISYFPKDQRLNREGEGGGVMGGSVPFSLTDIKKKGGVKKKMKKFSFLSRRKERGEKKSPC